MVFFLGPLKLAPPPGRGRMRAAPSPTPPQLHPHSTRHHSTSDEDNNAYEDKEEVNENFVIVVVRMKLCLLIFDIVLLFRFTSIRRTIHLFQSRVARIVHCWFTCSIWILI